MCGSGRTDLNQNRQTVTVTIKKGECLHDVLARQGYEADLPCGGNGTCGLCSVYVERFGNVRSCQFRLPGTYQVLVKKQAAFDAVGAGNLEFQFSGDAEKAFVAIDIGTTTVAWLAAYQGRQLSGGFVNPQRQYGADVMSRIRQSESGNGCQMQRLLAERISKELTQALQTLSQGMQIADAQIAIAANTTMLHILNGWDCAGLGKAPFAPHSLALSTWNAGEWRGLLGMDWLDVCRNYTVTELPGISTFIGADIVSGMLATHMADAQEVTLLVDLGTNGEMVLGTGERFLAASTAAGPAFEVSEAALQLHASGIFKALHQMCFSRAMDETGLLAEPYFSQGYPVGAVTITQDMVRDFQMAKAAIRAGIELLLREYGITAQKLDRIYLAGGMGYYMNPEDAIAIGLLPEIAPEKVQAVGNTSLKGLARYLNDPASAAVQMEQAVAKTTEIILADHPEFEETYLEYMSFPV